MGIPQPGDVYEALADFAMQCFTTWAARYAGDGEGTVPIRAEVGIETLPRFLTYIQKPSRIGALILALDERMMRGGKGPCHTRLSG
jgi:hypothetical protein